MKASTSQLKLQKTRSQEERIVYQLTKNTVMKFRPERSVEDPPPSGFIDRIRSLSKFFSRESGERSPPMRRSNELQTIKNPHSPHQGLKFLFRLENQTYLIGNPQQLDAINISIVDDYIETQQLWSLRLKSHILNLIVDDRRKTIIVVIKGQILIYFYEGRKSKKHPQLQKSFRILDEIKMIQLAKDSLLTVFLETSVLSFILDGPNSRQNFKKQYKVQKQLKLFQLAQCIENVLNVFFQCPMNSSSKFFQLWCMSIEITSEKLILGEVKKIYEIEIVYRNSLKIESITKDSYFMNLGHSILMFWKGYCVDKVFINLKVQGTLLKYFGDKKLIHISSNQIDFYHVIIDLVSNPPKLAISSFDSITNIENQKYSFLDAIKLQEHKIAFFYQLSSPNNSGEVKYIFNLTQKWKYEDKLDRILPKISEYQGKYQGQQFKKLQAQVQLSCDIVGKMGMSRKEAYLRIWRQSKKQQVEQFKFLLDTLDYNTIRQEILLKLRKKSMTFLQVHKMQLGCLAMIGENLFSAKNFSIDEIKNYLTSHFLIRKLELFKEIKLYQRKIGKLKISDNESNQKSKDKLFINIQQYSNTMKMDIKTYLIELIYNFIRYKKELKTQIRMVIRKFKFAFLFIYETLLKEIVNTVKEDLLYLLKNIPQLLPFTQTSNIDHEQASLLAGLWSEFKQQQWDGALYLNNIVTIYNKEMISEFSSNIWTKRYWLTYHDMIFLQKKEMKEHYDKIKAENLFYNLLEHIFDNYRDQNKILDLINYLEDTYILFPPHLYNNVQLYRELFNYFRENQVMNQPFQHFLKKTDQEIFKKIFDHEKFKKGSFLKEIKPIYQNLKQSDKFNIGLLKYFSSNLSQVSDIKYLLNRINNQKRQFHAQNEEMYEVLVKGMQIKLKLGSEKDIPISQVLIYIENIPLTDDNPVSKQLKILQKINEQGDRFKKMKLNMSIFQMIRNRDSVLLHSVSYQINQSGVKQNHQQAFVLATSKQIIENLSKIRRKIYGPFQDNANLFIYLIKLLESIELVPFVHKIIQQNINEECTFNNGDLENLVFYCYRQKILSQPIYQKSRSYLDSLIILLEEDNYLRIFIKCELELASIFSKGGKQIRFPISGESGLITKNQLSILFQSLTKEALLQISVPKVYEFASQMQKVMGSNQINLYELYQIYFMCLLNKRGLQNALNVIKQMIQLQPENNNNIVYPIMIFKWISSEFTDENRSLMINLLMNMFKKPLELISLFEILLSKSFSNDDQKQFLTENANLYSIAPESKMKIDNVLFNNDIIDFLKQSPHKCEKFLQLFHQQYLHLCHVQQQFSKNIDILIFHLFIVQQPILFIKYVHLNRYILNLREVKSFLSHLCKYEAYDQIKILEFSKRMFRLLYDIEKKEGEFKSLIQDVLSSPLVETRTIETLDATSDNLAKLSKAVDRFKGKLKYKMSSSSIARKRSVIIESKQSSFQKIDLFLSQPQRYFQKSDYTFNDSDGFAYKKQYLQSDKLKENGLKLQFGCKKYLSWMFKRTNQQIEYYLLKVNENEADETQRLQEEALKLSFRKAPNDRAIKDNAQIVCRAFAKVIKAESTPRISEQLIMPPISAIPMIPSSAISIGQIWEEQIEEVHLGVSILKDEIIKSISLQDDRLNFDTKILHNFGTTQQLENAFPGLMKQIYADQNLDYATGTVLMGQIHKLYPKCTSININFLEIYSKVQQLQKKLGLNLQTRLLLPFQGLLLKQKDCIILFNFIKEFLLPHLNENNIYTLSRIIQLSFKKPELKQEVINQFFKIIVKEYNELNSLFDENMKLQKIIAFAQKMPLNHLKLEIEKIVEVISNPQKIRNIIGAISNVLRQRNDSKNADLLEAKWLTDKVASPEDVQ